MRGGVPKKSEATALSGQSDTAAITVKINDAVEDVDSGASSLVRSSTESLLNNTLQNNKCVSE